MVIGLCIYLLQIPVPQLIAQPLELMANMTTPLSMVITGMLLAAGDLGCIVRSKPVWKLAAVRMLLIPAVCLAVFGLLGFRSMTAQVVLLLECRRPPSPRCLRCSLATTRALPPAAWS